MDLEIKFVNQPQRDFYFATDRNQCFSGGFNNGKSYVGCLKAFTLLSTFDKYRFVIARQVRADLMKTTYQTFFKICPREFVETQNLQEGYTYLKNGSRIDWLHLDNIEESTLRGLEINSVLVDQAEEEEEKVYDVLDARIGRWDEVVIPDRLLRQNPNWPKNPFTGKYIAPSYHLNLCNPDTQYHHLYRHYHPDSLERKENHFYVEGEWDRNLGSVESYVLALGHDEEWVNKYVKGQWSISNAQIHRIWPESTLSYNEELLDKILRKGNLFRVLDHGDSSPTCCLWFAALDGVFIGFREYYVPNRVISEHRRNINALSGNEIYSANYADPQIFKKTAQKDGGFWTVADEYLTNDIKAPPLAWIPADNNEFATRNRINELLKPSENFRHPVTGETPAPGLYFIQRDNSNYPQGCERAIKELGMQRRKSLGYIDGKQIYCDDREDSISDHAYDCIRYFVAMHGSNRTFETRKPPRNSIAFYKHLIKMNKNRLQAASA